jgi:3D (Asp-Asp-Asp) domain-containing protein
MERYKYSMMVAIATAAIALIMIVITIYLVTVNKDLKTDLSYRERLSAAKDSSIVDLSMENFELKNNLEKTVSEREKLKADHAAVVTEALKLKKDAKEYLSGQKYFVKDTLNIVASAYTQRDEEGTADGITFTETHVTEGRTIAVDPKVIPLGSTVYIESDSPYVGGFYIAEDIGGAIKGNRIDIYMESQDKAFDFGKQKITATVLEEIEQ